MSIGLGAQHKRVGWAVLGMDRIAGVLEAIGDALCMVDRNWRLVYANRRALELWGVSRQSVTGRIVWDRFPQIVGTPTEEALRRAARERRSVAIDTLSPVLQRWISLTVTPYRQGLIVHFRDIGERKATQETLRRSEARFRALFAQAAVGIKQVGLDGRLVEANEKLCEILGRSPEELVGQSIAALTHPEDWPREAMLMAEALEGTARGYAVEKRHLRKDGSPVWVRVTSSLAADGERGLYWISVVEDIHARKHAEEALRLSEERFRTLSEVTLEGVSIHDGQCILDANASYARMFGYGLDEIIGLRLDRLIAPEAWAEADARVKSGHEKPYESIGLSRDGSRFPVQFSSRPIEYRGSRVRVAIARDISERKRVEAELRRLSATLERRVEERTRELVQANRRLVGEIAERRQAEAELRRERQLSELLIESRMEGVVALDPELRITLWNAGMEALSGLRRDEVLGRHAFEAFPFIFGAPAEVSWRNALDGRSASLQDQPYRIAQTGRVGFFDANFAPLHGPDRALTGAIAFVRDVSERHHIEEQLRQAQRMEAVGQLTGGVAHDFNNLLTVIVGNLELLDTLSETSGRQRELVAAAERAAERGERLTKQLLAFSRRQALKPEVIDVNAVLGELTGLWHRAVGEAIEVCLDLASDLWPCEVDPAQLEAAVLNLVVNARDAMAGTGTLTLATANRRVMADLVAEMPPGDYVLLSVRDTGTGMAPEVLARAFEPFFTTKEVGKGSGLGLSMVYGFVKQSGGMVRIDSTPGAGTLVHLYLPRAIGAAAAGTVAGMGFAQAPRGSARVLIVEDEEDVRRVSIETLRMLGYHVLVAQNGPQALEILHGVAAVDLLFTDIVMPSGMSGVELAREARRLRPEIRVLLTSGYASDRVTTSAAASGEAFIAKPYRPSELGRKIEEVLNEPAA